MKKTMTRARAIKQGTIDGTEDAELILAEQGHEAASSCSSWGAMARGAKLAPIMGIPLELEHVYYAAYELAAVAWLRAVVVETVVCDAVLVEENAA